MEFFDTVRGARLEHLNSRFVHLFATVEQDEIINFDPPSKYLVLVCGANSSGKDTILTQLRGRLGELGIRSRFIAKYLTRPQRPGESDNVHMDPTWADPSSEYVFLTVKKFSRNADIVSKYEKEGFQYGFSRADLMSHSENDRILLGVYGDINKLPEEVAAIEEDFDRKCIVYIIRSDVRELESRTRRRAGFLKEISRIHVDEVHVDAARIDHLLKGPNEFKPYTNTNDDNPDNVAERILRDLLLQMELIGS